MLGEFPIDVVLLATDLDASRDFYANKIGLEIESDTAYGVQFKCGGGSRLGGSKSTVDSQTRQSRRARQGGCFAASHPGRSGGGPRQA